MPWTACRFIDSSNLKHLQGVEGRSGTVGGRSLGSCFFWVLHGLALTYLADNCLAIPAIDGRWQLRSAGTGTLSVPRTRTMLGMRSFAVAGPFIWNSLPATLRTATLSPSTFVRHLKAHLFVHLSTIYDALYKSTHHHRHYQQKHSKVRLTQKRYYATRVVRHWCVVGTEEQQDITLNWLLGLLVFG